MEAVLDLPPTKTPIKRLPIERLAAVECVRLHNISWETYRQLVEDQMGKPSVRLTYDTGDLEITVVSYKHENYSFTLNAIVSTVSDWLEIDFVAAGSTTFRGEKKQKGFEGDGSFYFRNAQVIRGKSAIDLSFDPSPELIIEVDITHGSLSKFPILYPKVKGLRKKGSNKSLIKM